MPRPDHQDAADLRTAGTRPGRICLGIAGVLSVAALAACGSSSSSQPPSSATSAASSAAGGMSSAAGSMSSMMPAPTTAASSAGASQPAAEPAVITISKFAYAVPVSVSPGAMITVMNKDEEAHTVTADSGNAFDDMATAGASTQFKAPTKPGSYPFHCTYHSNMHGVLVVK